MNLRTLRVIEYNKIVEMLTTFASSPKAKRKCQRIKPRKDLAMIETLQQETRDALRRLNTQGNLSFAGLKDIGGSLKRLEVEGKVADRGFVGRVGEQIADLPFQAREDQPVVAVLSGGCNECHGGAAGLDDKAAERLDCGVAIHVEADLQKALFLAAVERQNLMAL